ncbi:MAG: PEP-CTERM-box response regulator transcription factor [Rhodocyclaceae bacterium]|nr:PEP-CTERM-box response regulator transcription factor [Rhodocyclaceae bacterium]
MSEAQRPLLIVEDDPALQKQMRWSFDRYETLAFRLHDLQQENKRLQAMRQPDAMSGIISRDPEMLRVCRVIEKVANTNATVLILGESGTGKELLARGLHESSTRRGQRFVAINCAAIPENLLESELFGYEKGAFTGAAKTTPGKIELADKGTLFLDEIGDLPLALQAKLLRFLQERVFERVGGRQEIAIDVRIVCATHQDLKELIKAGRFREDLYYRLAEIVTVIPPLRARIGDAVLLANAFARRFAEQHSRGAMVLTADALRAIEVHGWPGNVRELENCIKRAVIMADNTQITADDVGLAAADDNPMAFDLRTIREAAEKTAVLAVMARVNGNIAKAAEMLGVSRPTLYDLMHRFGLK